MATVLAGQRLAIDLPRLAPSLIRRGVFRKLDVGSFQRLRLRLRPKEAVTPDLIEILKQHKAEIITTLSGRNMTGFGKCPGPEKCDGCYEVPGGRRIHPPKCSREWLAWFRRWSPHGQDRIH